MAHSLLGMVRKVRLDSHKKGADRSRRPKVKLSQSILRFTASRRRDAYRSTSSDGAGANSDSNDCDA